MPLFLQLTRGYYTCIDEIDCELDEANWLAVGDRNIYAARRVWLSDEQKQVTVYLHRVILSRMLERDLVDGEQADHINGNKLDNRRENIRLASAKDNARNRGVRSDSQSGVLGVQLRPNGKFQAYIAPEGKMIVLGLYTNIDDAKEARQNAEVKHYGEFSYTLSRGDKDQSHKKGAAFTDAAPGMMTKRQQGQPIAPRIESIITALAPRWVTRNRIAEELGRPIGTQRRCVVLNPADITALNKLVKAGKVEHRISYSDQSGYNRIVHEYRLKQ